MVITAGAASHARSNPTIVLNDLATSQEKLDRLGDALSSTMANFHALQEQFEKAMKKQAKSLRQATSMRPSSEKNSRQNVSSTNTQSSAETNSPIANGDIPSEDQNKNLQDTTDNDSSITADEFDTQLDVLKGRLKQKQPLMPCTGGMFVEMFLGSINVRFRRKSERLAFKSEYEKLKMKLAPFFVIFSVLCLVYQEYRWLHMILQLALSCYYVTLAVRENILRMNGSNIRSWWIIHHYFTTMQGVLLLTWPDGESYAQFRNIIHFFGLYNAVLMILQTRYQMARLYTLRSLGMANEMDVAASDSMQIHWSPTMSMLLPLIVLGQIMQALQAISLFRLYSNFKHELQILLLALLFAANFLGNSTTTVQVLLSKRAKIKQVREQTESNLRENGDTEGGSTTHQMITDSETTLEDKKTS